MLLLPGKKIAFVFSDPSGANACIALARMMKAEHNISPLLFSNKNYQTGDKEDVNLINDVPDFKQMGIDCIFTGTSHPQSSNYFEVRCIKQAKVAKIKSISFVDHWVNFKLRFIDDAGNYNYPDEIWVVDENAKELAILEGLPEQKIFIHVNPYHQYLEQWWKPVFENKHYLRELNISTEGYHILFAPDPLSSRNGKELAGFTEDEALSDLMEVLSRFSEKIVLIIKTHPLQPTGILNKTTDQNKIKQTHFIAEANTLELINAADLVIGFYSNLLLEAQVLGKKTIRYFPGDTKMDLLKHNTSMPKAESTEELFFILNDFFILQNKKYKKRVNGD